MIELTDQEREQMREMFVGEIFDLFDWPQGKISEERWQSRRKILGFILGNAAGFYDDHDCYDYDVALTLANYVIKGGSTEKVIYCMAALAYYMLKPDDDVVSVARNLTADERARLERIRDTSPDFAGEEQ
jgi:hypothetical protein